MAKKKTNSTPLGKPDKPSDDYPLYAHSRGYWAKKIKRKIYYFGKWDDPDGALAEYNRVKDHLYAGRTPPPKNAGTTELGDLSLKYAINLFLDFKRAFVESREISRDMWREYKRNGATILRTLGEDTAVETLTAEHFVKLRSAFAKGRSAATLAGDLTLARALFRWLVETEKVDRLPYRVSLQKPSKSVMRKARNAKPEKLFAPAEIQKLIKQATGYMKPAILLAANCGLGNRDVTDLRWTNLRGGWLDYPRNKTGIKRRAKLWDETIAALDEWKAIAPKSEFVCCGQHGQALGTQGNATPIAHLFRTIAKEAKVTIPDRHGFYTIRHSYRTAVDSLPDLAAVRMTMGHNDASIDDHYREKIDNSRLEAVATLAHHWLFGSK